MFREDFLFLREEMRTEVFPKDNPKLKIRFLRKLLRTSISSPSCLRTLHPIRPTPFLPETLLLPFPSDGVFPISNTFPKPFNLLQTSPALLLVLRRCRRNFLPGQIPIIHPDDRRVQEGNPKVYFDKLLPDNRG